MRIRMGLAWCAAALCCVFGGGTAAADDVKLADGATFRAGAINGVLLEKDGKRLAIYGWPETGEGQIETVLLAHSRRDVVAAAKPAVAAGASVIAPDAAKYWLEQPHEFWNGFVKSRFHDYAQRSTKVLAEPLAVKQYVKNGDEIAWQGLTLKVLDTPGFTRDSVTYLAEIGGRKLAFTGDLIYGDGKILDLYSFQDAIPEAQIQGYHGYGSRLAGLVTSLKLLREQKPDVLVPARGPLIRDPAAAIDRLIGRVHAVYHNYLSTNALHWYFKEERMRLCGQRVLGSGEGVELMPYSHHEPVPNWVFEHSTSRLLIAENGHGFLLDCGYQRVIDAVKDLMAKGLVKQVDGIFVTHFHDDHTDMVQAAAEEFKCPVYASEEFADLLERPEAYHLPAVTPNAIKDVKAMKSGTKMPWHEFTLTFHYFPGQAWHHGGLLVKKRAEKPIFFIGDSFAPSGMDDYCVLNRNLLHDDEGYLLCLKKLREVGEDFWLVNEHINFVFSYSDAEMKYLETRYRQRIDMQRDLYPFDDPNYGVDEQWAFFYPHGATFAANSEAEVELRFVNHSSQPRTFSVKPHGHSGLQVLGSPAPIELAARKTGVVKVRVKTPAQSGNFLLTADIRSEGIELLEWSEALITVK